MDRHTSERGGRIRWAAIIGAAAATLTVGTRAAAGDGDGLGPTQPTQPVGMAPADPNTVRLDGSFFTKTSKPDWTGTRCPSGAGDECGVLQLVDHGAADYVYVYGPTFEPHGPGCFDVDGTFTITLQSDGSRVSGPLTGLFCGPGESARQIETPSYGGPHGEDDRVEFTDGSGRFEGLHGTASFSQREAGAQRRGTLTGTLSG